MRARAGPPRPQPAVDRDLETICLKCLEKDPERATARPRPWRTTWSDSARGADHGAAGGPVVEGWRWVRRNPIRCWSWWALVGMLFIVGIIGADRLQTPRSSQKHKKNTQSMRNAQRNRAKRAFDDMYTQVAERFLPNVPGMEPVRRELLVKRLEDTTRRKPPRGMGPTRPPGQRLPPPLSAWGRIHHGLSEIDPEERAFGLAVSLLEQLGERLPQRAQPPLVACTKSERVRTRVSDEKPVGPEAAESLPAADSTRPSRQQAAFPDAPSSARSWPRYLPQSGRRAP